jgi:hypothetical protein
MEYHNRGQADLRGVGNQFAISSEQFIYLKRFANFRN